MTTSRIERVRARRIFDGAARRSLEVQVETDGGTAVAAPSYSDPRSSGKYEIRHFPEGGVDRSIDLINTVIDRRLQGVNAADQDRVDGILLDMDGTESLEILGGNTVEAVSMAVAKAAAAALQVPLYRHAAGSADVCVPHLMLNIIGGGATMGDESWRGRTPDLQDHLVVPVNCSSVLEEMEALSNVFHIAGSMIRDVDPRFAGGRDEEYCWIPNLDDETCMEILERACTEAAKGKAYWFRLGLDVGASDLWQEDEQKYVYGRQGVKRTLSQQSEYVAGLVERFDLFYIEDAFAEDHMELYCEHHEAFGKRALLVGDDMLATNETRLMQAIDRRAVNAAVVKLNMAGTVSRTAKFVDICHRAGVATIGASRTYDSPDDTIADLVCAWGSTGYKCGSPAGGEHVAKYNRFIRIEEEGAGGISMARYQGPAPDTETD